MKKSLPIVVLCALVTIDILLRLGSNDAWAQEPMERHPTALTAVEHAGIGGATLYRMWSDGSIDVRMVSQPVPGGLTPQKGWVPFQVGD